MAVINKKWMACFYSFLIISVFFGELTEATGGLIPRGVLFPREEEDPDFSVVKTIRRSFTRGLVEIFQVSDCEDGWQAFFAHVTPKNHSEENHKGTSVLYYYWDGEFFKISRDDTPSPHLEEAFVEKGFALWSYASGQSRDFCVFDLKKRTSEVVARDFSSLIVDESRRPLAGVKMTGTIMGFYANAVKGGWKLLEEVNSDPNLMHPFKYQQRSRSLFFFPNHGLWRIDLETGEKETNSIRYVDSSCDVVEKRWSCDSDFKCFRKKINGLDSWTGNPLFNFVYKRMEKELSKELKGESFSVDWAQLYPEVGFSFVLKTKEYSKRSGTFNLETESFLFYPEPGYDQRLAFRDCVSEKIYGEMNVPLVYGVPDYLFKLSYYVSYPTRGEAPFPSVALVHGGPNCEDEFGFDPQVQHLTSRGYAVVQVNYRGSTDSQVRMRAGIGQAGDSMQRDVIQVLDHLIKQRRIGPNNIAIMGGSYGGYAALVGATRGAEFHTDWFKGFKCAMACYPTSSLLRTVEESMYQEKNRTPPSIHMMAPSVLETGSISGADRERLLGEAPLTHAARLNIPLLLVHGKYDSITPIAHSLDFAEVCDHGFLEGLIVVEEAHGWENIGNIRALSYATEAFLKKYLHGGDIEPLAIEDVLFTDMAFVSGAHNFPELHEMLEKYRGFGNLHLSADVQDWLFPHPQRYAFPYPQYFAHEGNAISAPRHTITLSDLCRVLNILLHARNYFISPLI